MITHRAPSVGSVIKRMIEINPDLSPQELVEIVRKSIAVQGGTRNEFAQAETIDEEKAIQLARETLRSDLKASP